MCLSQVLNTYVGPSVLVKMQALIDRKTNFSNSVIVRNIVSYDHFKAVLKTRRMIF